MTTTSEPTSTASVPSQPATEPAAPMPLLSRMTGLMRRRVTWVLIDQGVVSLGNFLTISLLSRYLSKTDAGVFGVLLETINYLNSLQAALIIYPLTIKGATEDRSNLGRLATGAVLLTLALLPILGTATAGSVGALNAGNFAIAAVAALLLQQIQETLRRTLISDLQFAKTVWGDAVSYLGQALLIYALVRSDALNLNRTFVVMGVTSGAAIAVQAFQIGLKPIQFWQLRLVVRDFWRLGRWMLLANAGALVSSTGYWWVLEWSHGKEACAAFLAIALLFRLANPIVNSMAGLITPAVARAMATGGAHAARRVALRYTSLGAALLAPYFLILVIIPTKLLRLTSGEKYIDQAHLLQLFVVNYTVVYFMSSIGAWLSGLGRSRYNFYVQVVGVIVALLIGLPLTRAWGVSGLIIGGLFSAGLAGLASAYFIHKVAMAPGSATSPPAPTQAAA